MAELAALYTEIKVRAPRALVLVLGYPRTVAPTGTCTVTDLSSDKRTAVNGLADALAEGTGPRRCGRPSTSSTCGRSSPAAAPAARTRGSPT